MKIRSAEEMMQRALAALRLEVDESVVASLLAYHAGAVAEVSKKIEDAIDLAIRYGQIDGDHHKMWVIDQMVRTLAGDRYERIIADANDGEDGPNTYSWDVGIAP